MTNTYKAIWVKEEDYQIAHEKLKCSLLDGFRIVYHPIPVYNEPLQPASQKTIETFVNELCDWDASDERRDYWIKELTSLVKQAQIEAIFNFIEFMDATRPHSWACNDKRCVCEGN